MKVAATFCHNTRITNSFFLSAEVKRVNGFDYAGVGDVIWYATENDQFLFIPVSETSILGDMNEYYFDNIVDQLGNIGPEQCEERRYHVAEGADHGFCFVIHYSGNVEVYQWKIEN